MVKEWQNRTLGALYSIIFMDAIHFKVRHEGFKEVLGIWIGESESSKFWLMVAKLIRKSWGSRHSDFLHRQVAWIH